MPIEQATLPWPELPLEPWRPTRDTLHMWTQIVGKTLLALAPAQNHWWHTALRVTARGLASAPISDGGRSFDIELDLVGHALSVRSDGRFATMALAPRTVRSFYEEYLALLRELGVQVHLWPMPVEVPDPIPFDRDEVHRSYDAGAVHRFGQVLRCCDAALKALSNGFLGKQSPVHFFWGSFDLAATRFSGRRAPARPKARYDARLGEFILPYAAVREADDPALAVRAFCESVYEAGARLGNWDRDVLERAPQHAG